MPGDEGFSPVDGDRAPGHIRLGRAPCRINRRMIAMIPERSGRMRRAHRRFGCYRPGSQGSKPPGGPLSRCWSAGEEKRQVRWSSPTHGCELAQRKRRKVDRLSCCGALTGHRHSGTRREASHARQPPSGLVGPRTPCEVTLPARARPRQRPGFMRHFKKLCRTGRFRSRNYARVRRRWSAIYIVSQFLAGNSIWRHFAAQHLASVILKPFYTGLVDRSPCSSVSFWRFRDGRADSARAWAPIIRARGFAGGRAPRSGHRRQSCSRAPRARCYDLRLGGAGGGTAGLIHGPARRLRPAVFRPDSALPTLPACRSGSETAGTMLATAPGSPFSTATIGWRGKVSRCRQAVTFF